MKNPYFACSSCDCYVKRSASRCPFCGAISNGRAESALSTPRMSRSRWLAASTLAIASSACTSAPVASTLADASLDATEEARAPLTLDPRVPSPSCGLRGSFACGTNSCARATEYCLHYRPGYGGEDHCESYTPSNATQLDYWNDGSTCGTCPQCGCAERSYEQPRPFPDLITGCAADDGGGVTLAAEVVGPCYGAPPARVTYPGATVARDSA